MLGKKFFELIELSLLKIGKECSKVQIDESIGVFQDITDIKNKAINSTIVGSIEDRFAGQKHFNYLITDSGPLDNQEKIEITLDMLPCNDEIAMLNHKLANFKILYFLSPGILGINIKNNFEIVQDYIKHRYGESENDDMAKFMKNSFSANKSYHCWSIHKDGVPEYIVDLYKNEEPGVYYIYFSVSVLLPPESVPAQTMIEDFLNMSKL
jgi:hypothetical protein